MCYRNRLIQLVYLDSVMIAFCLNSFEHSNMQILCLLNNPNMMVSFFAHFSTQHRHWKLGPGDHVPFSDFPPIFFVVCT